MKAVWSFLVLASIISGTDYSKIPLLKWAGPPGSKPDAYEEWISQHPYTDFSWSLDRLYPGDGRQGNAVIICQQSIASALTNEIDRLADNLQLEGYTIMSYQMSGGTPESLRTFLQGLDNSIDIEGALFIGNLPVAWFEIANDFNTYGYADFPIDLFYMDLNGTWLDTMNTGNGKYDGHTGEINPEIYIGRLTPTGIGDDTLLLKNYFRKDNAYRYDTLELRHRALVFCDDDWIPWAPQWASDVALLYPDTMDYWDAETTRATVYRAKLDSIQAWVSVFVHSWPGGHQFVYNSGGSYEYYYSTEYTTQDPPANFYNHFACSFSRYTTSGYGGGRSVFNQTSGLGETSSTKTGSMLEFYYFYQPLSQQKTMGEAFKTWFTYITSNGVTFDEMCWHYGMTLLGDPYLKPTGHNVSVAELKNPAVSDQPLMIIGNPSIKSVKIQLNLRKPTKTCVNAYDCLGRLMKTLIPEKIISGKTETIWSFDDELGNILPNGVYLIKAAAEGACWTQKAIKLQ